LFAPSGRRYLVSQTTPKVPTVFEGEDARLQSLGYKPQLNRVLGLFANFSVAFTYLSPMVGIYSLFALGVGTGGPAYLWLMPIPVLGMLFVALVFGELASHYPVAGALYQYSKFSAGSTASPCWSRSPPWTLAWSATSSR
jgi:amino acid transporter